MNIFLSTDSVGLPSDGIEYQWLKQHNMLCCVVLCCTMLRFPTIDKDKSKGIG